mgnify:CR=1 FL=1
MVNSTNVGGRLDAWVANNTRGCLPPRTGGGVAAINSPSQEFNRPVGIRRSHDSSARVIAEASGLALTERHFKVINYLREKYKEDGHTPNLRNLVKGLQEEGGMPEADSNLLFELFPDGGAAKQGCKVAGLPQPKGKGGY